MNLDGPVSYKYFRADKNIPNIMYYQRQNAGRSVIVWGAILATGTMALQIMTRRCNEKMECLTTLTFLKERNRLCSENFIFQQDGATIHTAKSSLKYFDAKGIEIIPWSVSSADLNSIENVCDWLSTKFIKKRSSTALSMIWRTLSIVHGANLMWIIWQSWFQTWRTSFLKYEIKKVRLHITK